MNKNAALLLGFVMVATGASAVVPTSTHAQMASSTEATSSPITTYNPGGPIIISPAHPILPISLSTSLMSFGSDNMFVKILQEFLNQNGYTVATSGAGSNGNESTYFGSATRAALEKFQAAHGIPATGNFGILTRALIAQLVGTGSSEPITDIGGTEFQDATITCLPHLGEVSTMECAFGLETAPGVYYALDLSQVPTTSLPTSGTVTVIGNIETSSTQSASLMQEYNIQGVILVKSIST